MRNGGKPVHGSSSSRQEERLGAGLAVVPVSKRDKLLAFWRIHRSKKRREN